MTLTDAEKTAAHNAYSDALARSDDGIGTHEQQARDKQIIDRYEASSLGREYDDYEYARQAAAEAESHVVEFGHLADEGTWWWECSWGGFDYGYDSEAEMRKDADGHEHLDERTDP